MKIRFLILFLLFCSKVYAEPSPEGIWSVRGQDDANTSWKAKLVLKSDDKDNYPPLKFKGYFDWEGSNGMKGREYIIQGNFDYDTRILKLSGTELEDAHPGIKTSLYTITMNKNADKLEDGNWRSCGVVPGIWEATRSMEVESKNKTSKKPATRRKDVAREKCEGDECVLEKK